MAEAGLRSRLLLSKTCNLNHNPAPFLSPVGNQEGRGGTMETEAGSGKVEAVHCTFKPLLLWNQQPLLSAPLPTPSILKCLARCPGTLLMYPQWTLPSAKAHLGMVWEHPASAGSLDDHLPVLPPLSLSKSPVRPPASPSLLPLIDNHCLFVRVLNDLVQLKYKFLEDRKHAFLF